MYDFEINIGSLGTPIVGGGWVDVGPVYNSSVLQRAQEANVRVRDNLSGSLTFLGTEYTALDTLTELIVPIRVKVDSVVRLTGQLSLQGKYDTIGKEVELTFEQDDQYTTMLQNMDVEVALKQLFLITIDQDYTSQLEVRGQAVEFAGTPSFATFDGYSNCGQESPNVWNAGITYIAANITGSSPNTMYSTAVGDFNNVYVRVGGSWYASLQSNNLNNPPASSPTYWDRIDEPYAFKREYADFQFDEDATYSVSNDYWFKAGCTTDSYTFNQDSALLFDVLEDLLAEADSAITITAGTYCTYFNTYFTYFLNLYIYSFEDEPKAKLSNILDMFKVVFNLDWYLDSSKNFFFKHPREINKTVGVGDQYNLETYLSDNWTNYIYQFALDQKVSKETWQFGVSTRLDFDVQGITYDNHFQDIKEYKMDFSTDFKGAQVDQDGFLLMCAEMVMGNLELRNRTGLISTNTEYNGELACTRAIDDHQFYDRPFDEGTYLSTVEALDQIAVNKVQLEVPYLRQDIIDFDNLIQTTLANLEVEELSIPLAAGMATITGRYE